MTKKIRFCFSFHAFTYKRKKSEIKQCYFTKLMQILQNSWVFMTVKITVFIAVSFFHSLHCLVLQTLLTNTTLFSSHIPTSCALWASCQKLSTDRLTQSRSADADPHRQREQWVSVAFVYRGIYLQLSVLSALIRLAAGPSAGVWLHQAGDEGPLFPLWL